MCMGSYKIHYLRYISVEGVPLYHVVFCAVKRLTVQPRDVAGVKGNERSTGTRFFLRK